MRLILVRHADPDYANDALTPKGHIQAERLAETMRGTKIDEMFVSPMGRARMTAEYIAEALGATPSVLPWLHELNGNFKDDLWCWNQHGGDLHARDVNWDLENWSDNVPYGEHMIPVANEFYSSFDAFMRERGLIREKKRYKVEKENDSTVLFVCHGGVILTKLGKLLHVPLPIIYAHFEISPSGRTEFSTNAKDGYSVWRKETMNDMSHARDLWNVVQQTGRF